MKLLHTSDWHVGRTIRGRSRAAEHEAVLAEIAEVARAEAVDLVLVVGDLFDTAAPTAEAERIVWRGLLDLASTGADVLVVAGNHDNERRLQAVAPVLDLGRIITRATFARPDDGGVVSGTSRAGEPWRVALLPFLSQRYVVRAADLMDLDAGEHAQQYAGRVSKLCEVLTASFTPDAVNIVAAHLFVSGGRVGGGERDAHTIFDYHVPAHAFPASTHYVALGHLHRQQSIAAGCPVWYSGSPLQLDFGETANEPGVLVVEARPGAPADVRAVPLKAGRRLRSIEGTLADLQVLATSGSAPDAHLRVVVREPRRAGLADDVRSLLPDAVDVVVRPPDDAAGETSGASPARTRAGRSPRELFEEFLRERNEVDERVLALFDELHDEIHAPDPA